MAEKFVVKAEKRVGRGTNFARGLRREGKIPATVYGGGGDAVAITAELSDLAAIIRSDSGANTLFTLDIEGEQSRVIFQDRQIDPVLGKLLHADLRRLSKGEKIELTIPVHLIGTPKGVSDGGVLEQLMREINVKCLPSNIPDSIDVDVENLEMNESISIENIEVDEGVEILDSPESVIASVVFVREEVEEVEEVEEGLEPGIVGEEEEDEGVEEDSESNE
jgi:large subunit ribosomal protein L25